MKRALILAFCIFAIGVNAQTMTTFCGNGTPASSGDGGPATSAAINGPSGIVFDAAGNTYVSEYSSSKIRKINSAGIITTFAGTGTAGFSGDGGAATSAKINHPIKLLIDAAGNIYVGDYQNNRIRMITPAGIISTFAGTGAAGSTGDGGPATSAAIYGPIGMDFDASGNMYVSDYNSYKIRKITPGGTITTIAGTGVPGFGGDGGLATAAKIHNVWGIKVDAAGNIYLADASNHRVRMISTSGIITTIAGTGTPGFSGDGGLATAAQLNNPSDIEIDAGGNIYIDDQVNNRVRMISPAGIITTVVGNGTATYAGDGGSPLTASINNSNDIAFSPSGELYICDDGNYRVRKVSDITGSLSVCVGSTSTLTDIAGGGTWSSGNTAIAAIGSGSGVVTGVAAGTTVISYITSGSTHTAIVTVLPLPNAGTITGTAVVCPSATTTLANPTGDPGGNWSSSTTSTATIGATTGVVSGVATGTSTITYTVTNSCGAATTTKVVTVSPLPNVGTIIGTATVCPAATTTLSNPSGDPGGLWTSVSTATATIGTSSGVVTGVTPGTSTISYTVTNSCGTAAATRVVTVNPFPNAGTIAGTFTVCPSATTTLSDPTGDAGGNWASSTTAVANIGATTGVVTGVATGTTTISYTVTNGCGTATATKVVTVSSLPTVGIITGASSVCPAATITLSDATGGGVWSSSVPARATVNATGVVTGVSAGPTTISYAVTNSCGTTTATKVVTVNPLPNPATITGTPAMCPGFTTTLSDATPGGAWSSGTTGVATVDAFGVVTGLTAGTTTISYSVTNGCGTTAVTVIATVNPLPMAISGPGNVCEAATIVLTDADPAGAWTASNANATVGASTGVVTGVVAGTVVITYTLPTSCFTTTALTVNALPSAYSVTGGGSYCAGGTGVHIGLSGSAVGIDYQLYNGASPISPAVAGTGSAIDFGLITPAGTYTVLASNGATSCTQNMSGSATIIVNPNFVPSVSITHSYPGTATCNGTSATFTAVATNGGPTPNYQWYVNGVAVGSSTSNYSYIPANGDVISVTLIPGGICVSPATAAANYTVSVLPVGTPTISITSSPGNPVCSGTTVLCNSLATFAGTAPTFLWLRNGINVATGATYSYIPTNGDVIICKMTSNYTCRTTDLAISNTLTMVVQPNVPGPVVNINAMPGTVISVGQTVTFSAVATGGSASKKYQWFINGTVVSGATNSTFVSNSMTNGSIVTCRVTNNDACANSTDKSVTISVGGLDVDGTVQATRMTLYPNPNEGTFVIRIPSIKKGSANVIILNALGEKVSEFTAATNEDIPLHLKAAAGMYFISAVTEETVFSTRFELY